jgi:signal transduction histidine kinase
MNELSCKELLLRIGELEEELDKSRAEANRLRAANAQQTGGDRATDVRALARTLSHDLRTPLVAVAGFGHLLRRRLAGNPDPKIDEYLNRLQEGVDGAQTLIDGIVEFLRSDGQALCPVKVEVSELFAEVMAETLPAEWGIRVSIAEGMPPIRADRQLLRRVAENLVGNAAASLRGRPDPALSVNAERMGSEVVVRVADNGPGIDPAEHERIFEPFVRLTCEREGNGLGLALARRFVEFHGGRIWVESDGKGTGSVFSFTLPHLEMTEG